MAKMLKFNGPKLPKDKHTWYERFRPEDKHGKEGLITVFAFPGDMVPADVIRKAVPKVDANGDAVKDANGADVLDYVDNVEYYLKAGYATLVDVPVPEAPEHH